MPRRSKRSGRPASKRQSRGRKKVSRAGSPRRARRYRGDTPRSTRPNATHRQPSSAVAPPAPGTTSAYTAGIAPAVTSAIASGEFQPELVNKLKSAYLKEFPNPTIDLDQTILNVYDSGNVIPDGSIIEEGQIFAIQVRSMEAVGLRWRKVDGPTGLHPATLPTDITDQLALDAVLSDHINHKEISLPPHLLIKIGLIDYDSYVKVDDQYLRPAGPTARWRNSVAFMKKRTPSSNKYSMVYIHREDSSVREQEIMGQVRSGVPPFPGLRFPKS